MNLIRQFVGACAVISIAGGTSALFAEDSAPRTGEQIFAQSCAECHGDRGQGIAGAAEEALYGSRTLEELTKTINDTMPEGDPEAVTGAEAGSVASYIYDTFYTVEARAQEQTARVELLHMTVPQYRNAVADLLATFMGRSEIGEEQGLSAEYYNERRRRRDKRVLERVDPRIEFDYGEGPPLEDKVKKDEFFIRWDGSLVVEESGTYEIIVRTGNGMRLWLNDSDTALIDAWVSSGGKVMEHRVSIDLLAGRAYPLELEFFKFRDKTASIELLWKPPHKTEELIPTRNLRTKEVPATFVVTTPFPPDDRSVGYERGSAVSQSWDEATTYAAVETAQYVIDHIDRLAGTKPDHKDRLDKWQDFCERLVERAFRRPLTDEQKQFFVNRRFEKLDNPEEAVKQVVLLALKSPRFLYLGIENEGQSPDYTVASRLSFGLWDSLPDEPLLQAASRGELHTPEQVAQHAERMLDDPRAKAKLHEFFHVWLMLDHADDLSKDSEVYPEFSEQIVSDLRTSLDLMLAEIAWQEGSDFRQLLLSNTMYVNKRLAEYYQVGKPSELSNEEFVPVELNESQRAGVMTHPYMLAALAYAQATSPIHRGVFLTRKIMNRPLNPPPAAIEFNDGRFDPHLTMREKVTELTKATACQSCHSIINPLGFTLEHFDATGRFRETEKEKPINTTSEYTTAAGESFMLTSARDLAEHAASNSNSQLGFAESLLHHVVKQPAAAYGPETLEKLRDDFAKADFSMRSLIVDIMKQTALHDLPSATTKP